MKPVPLIVRSKRNFRKRADAATRAAELSTARIGNLQGRFVRALVADLIDRARAGMSKVRKEAKG